MQSGHSSSSSSLNLKTMQTNIVKQNKHALIVRMSNLYKQAWKNISSFTVK